MNSQKTQVTLDGRYYNLICTMTCKDSKNRLIEVCLYKDIIGFFAIFKAYSYDRLISMDKIPTIEEVVDFASKED